VRSCAECGFDWDRTSRARCISLVRAAPARFAGELQQPIERLRRRPTPSTWSALEYAVHTAEALCFYEDRIARVLSEHRPRLAAYDFGRACDRDRYNERTLAAADAALGERARALAALLDQIQAAGWARVGIGSDGDERTVDTLARRAAHEVQHHLLDVQRVLDS
jgi:DinB superfamily